MGSFYVKGKAYSFNKGDRLIDAARLIQKDYDHQILLFSMAGKPRELHLPLEDNMELTPLTAADDVGMECYRRSAVFLLIKTLYNLLENKLEKVKVLYTIGNGVYIKAEGDFNVDGNFCQTLENSMQKYTKEDIEIKKSTVSTDDAIKMFDKYKLYDKRDLLEYRSASSVNIYSIGNFYDYYYGYMVYSTGALKYFKIVPYNGGIVLCLPAKNAPETVKPFTPMPKTFNALQKVTGDCKKMGVETVSDLNGKIVNGKIDDVIVMQETVMERRIAEIADIINNSGKKRFILVAGPSSSGKTTFSRRLSIQLMSLGLKAHPISLDDYFLEYKNIPPNENGERDIESISAVDIELFNRDMQALLSGKTVEMPHYSFVRGKREYNGSFLRLGDNDVFVIEGIHGLNPKMTESLPEECKYKIYISHIKLPNIDSHNRITTSDGRLIRRIVRDARTRGSDARETISLWKGVRAGEEKNIFPYQETADVIFSSSLVYEPAALKLWAEPLLYAVPKNCEEYYTAKRLLKFFDYFLAIDNDSIPNTSLIREFIGGGLV